MKKQILIDKLSNFINLTEDEKGKYLERKQYSEAIKLDETDESTFIAEITNTNVDEDGDIMFPQGIDLSSFITNSPLMWNHSYSDSTISSAPIGKVEQLQLVDNKIFAKVKMANGQTQFATELWNLVKGGYLKTVSIGFIATSALVKGTREFNNFLMEKGLEVSEECQRIITGFRIKELSLVPIPCNPDALIHAISTKSIHLSEKLSKEMHMEVKEDKETGKETIDKVDKVENKENEKESTTKTESGDNEVKPSPVVETKIEQPIEVKKESETIIPVVEPIKEPELVWNVIRNGDYQLTDNDKKMIKSIKSGKII